MIYVIGSATDWENSPIKIGFTGDESTKKRLGSIQTGNPLPLAVIHEMGGTEKEEKLIHSMMEPYRLNGEWFDAKTIPPSIRAEIVGSVSAKEFLSKITLAKVGILGDIESIVESKSNVLDLASMASAVETLVSVRLAESMAKCHALEIVLAAEKASVEAFSKSISDAMGSSGETILSMQSHVTEIRTACYAMTFALSSGAREVSMQSSVIANLLKSYPELLSIVVQKIKANKLQ